MVGVVVFGLVGVCLGVLFWRHHKEFKVAAARMEATRLEFEAMCAAAEADPDNVELHDLVVRRYLEIMATPPGEL